MSRWWPWGGGGADVDPTGGPDAAEAGGAGGDDPPDAAAGADPADAGPRTVCGLCGRAFREDRGQPACRSCPLSRACRYVRCPSCGYENPVDPGWLRRRGAAR